MSTLTDTVHHAQRKAAEIRPEVGGFPVLAEVLRPAGIHRNARTLPAGQSVYATYAGIDDKTYVESYPAVAI